MDPWRDDLRGTEYRSLYAVSVYGLWRLEGRSRTIVLDWLAIGTHRTRSPLGASHADLDRYRSDCFAYHLRIDGYGRVLAINDDGCTLFFLAARMDPHHFELGAQRAIACMARKSLADIVIHIQCVDSTTKCSMGKRDGYRS